MSSPPFRSLSIPADTNEIIKLKNSIIKMELKLNNWEEYLQKEQKKHDKIMLLKKQYLIDGVKDLSDFLEAVETWK